MKRSLAFGLLAVVLGSMLVARGAYPIIEEPVLRPDSIFSPTPWGYLRNDFSVPARPGGGTWPTVFTMEGYAGATRGDGPNAYLRMDDGELMALRIFFGEGPRKDYAFVQASIRGTECSWGHFELYDRRHAWDAHHIIEWIATQPWSNTRIGMFGSSFPGQTAYWTATTKPPHLYAVSANLLHSDIYRDIFMPGGVQNILFPSLWSYGLGVVAGPHRIPIDSVSDQVVLRDEICLQAQIARYSVGDLPQPENEAIWAGVRSVDDDWYHAHAALTYVDTIKIPYYEQQNWQDEQVGPRAVVLFNHIHPTPRTIIGPNGQPRTIVPKRFVVSNGDHGFGNFAGNDRWNWFDIWLLDRPDVAGLTDHQIVNYFETNNAGNQYSGTKSGDTWPFENTTYQRYYLGPDGGLGTAAPGAGGGSDVYLSGVPRQGWFFYAYDGTADPVAPAVNSVAEPVTSARSLPDTVAYQSAPLATQKVVAGPILMELYASLLLNDADFFVSISDVWPDGRVSYLQRGLLKASHRAVDLTRSYFDGPTLVQPYRPHTNPQPVIPNEINKYTIEIFPLGHVFRPGHKILIQIHTPPVVDGLWGYTPSHQPAAITVYHDAAHPSFLQLPVVTPDAPISNAEPADCKVPGGFPCYAPSPVDGG
jgi:putative CocE/NonD family hydrolase